MDFLGDRIIGRAIDDTGNVFDAFVIDKESENSPEEFISYEIFEIERDLTEAIINMPLAKIDGEVAIDDMLVLENPFSHPLQMTFSWEPTQNWITNEAHTEIILPGQSIKIKYVASAEMVNIHPIPTARLNFQTPDGKMAFRNSTIEFYPIKIGRNKSIEPVVAERAPIIDGNLTDALWKGVPILNRFNDVQGGLPLHKTEIAVCTNKAKNTLYISGRVEASVEISNSGVSEKDHISIIRYENIKVFIGVGSEVYVYIVNPKGTLMDTRDRTAFWNREAAAWNSSARSAGMPTKDGWQFELEIPLSELNIEGQQLAINFSRNDTEHKTQSEYALTYGISRLDHRVPMYDVDWFAVDRFAKLVLR